MRGPEPRTLASSDRGSTVTPPGPRVRLDVLMLLATAALLLAANAGSFLPHQSLWVDETTQLAGVQVGPTRILAWLVGRGPDLGVPPDRAPPLSYLVQMAWAVAAGSSETSLRWLSLLLSCAGVAWTTLAARRAHGLAAGIVAALFLALSPNMAVYAVEVRAYPLFFALSGGAAYLLVRAVEAAPGRRAAWIGALTAVLALAILTHFFGLVLAGATVLTLLTDAIRGRKRIGPVLLCGVALGVTACGLLPFVGAAGRLSASAEPASPGFRGVVRLLYRLYGHPALAGSRVGTALATGGFLLAVIAGIASRRAVFALVALASGLGVACTAALLVKGFDPTAPHYNVWSLPFVALLIGSGFADQDRRVRGLACLGAVALVSGTAVGSFELHRRPDVYAHGPQRALIDLVRRLGPEQLTIVYDSSSDASGHVFFPLRFTFGRSLPQYVCAVPCDRLVPFDPRDPIPGEPAGQIAVVVRTHHSGATELAHASPSTAFTPSTAAKLLVQRGFAAESRTRLLATVSADVEVLRRTR